MAAQSLVSAAIASAVVGVSAAGLATGTYIRNAEIEGLRASPIVTGALADATGGSTAPVKRADAAAIAPTFSRIVIEPKGISRLEGFAAPGGEVVIRSEGRQIAVAHAAEDGSWAVVLDQALPPGEHRLASTSDTGSRVLIGEDVRVFVPTNLDGPKVISYEAPVADPVRRRAESLAVNAGEGFDEVMARKAGETKAAAPQPSGTRVAEATADKKPVPEKSATLAEAETHNAVVDWLDRSQKMFHDFVAKPLSVPPATGAGTKDAAAKEAEGASLTDRVRTWFQGTSEVFHRDVVTPLKDGETALAAAPATGESGASAAKAAAAKAAEENAAADKAAAEKAAADRRRAEEDARRVAEEQKRAQAVLEAAEAKAAAEAKSAEALKKAEEARRREAEETARAEEEIKRAAAAAEKRTAETERKLEDGLKRLDDAEKAQRDADAAAKKSAEPGQRPAPPASKDGQDRNDKAEARGSKNTTIAEAAPTAPAPRNRPADPIVTVVPRSSQATPADEAEDARKEEEEYGILRRMMAEAKRLATGGEPAPAARKEEDTSEAEPSGPARVAAALSEARDHDGAEEPKPVARPSAKSENCRGGHRGRRAGYHFVGPNDTLWAIARRHYGDGNRYLVIYRANRDRIRDPDVLRPCQWIRIPGRR